MIKIRTKEVELQLSDYQEIIAARKNNEKLVSEVLGAIRRYEQSVKEQLEGGHEPLITEEEFLKQLARECWTSIPPNWLSKDASRRREVKQLTAPNLIIPSARSGGETKDENGENGRHHPKVDVNKNYLVVLRQRNLARPTPFTINPNIPLPLSFETLRSRRILNGQPASMRKNAPPSVFSPLFSHYKPNNASVEELSEEEREIFKQSVLPGKPKEEEQPKKFNLDSNTPVRSQEEIQEIVERVLNDLTAVQKQNQEDNLQRKEALLNHSKKHFIH